MFMYTRFGTRLNFLYTSIGAKRGRTIRTNIHTLVKKKSFKTQHGRIFAAIGHRFRANKQKTKNADTCGSEATCAETRNWRHF